jgi:hypothetical protein
MAGMRLMVQMYIHELIGTSRIFYLSCMCFLNIFTKSDVANKRLNPGIYQVYYAEL